MPEKFVRLMNRNALASFRLLLALLLFGALSWGHARLGWRGKTAITLTISGSVLLTLAYFGSRFVKEVLLGRF